MSKRFRPLSQDRAVAGHKTEPWQLSRPLKNPSGLSLGQEENDVYNVSAFFFFFTNQRQWHEIARGVNKTKAKTPEKG